MTPMRFFSRSFGVPERTLERSENGSDDVLASQAARFVLVLVVGTLALMGCDTSVQSVVPSDQHHYSIFGVVNPAEDTQWVRVEPLATPTSAGAPRTLDVTVTLKNLSTNRTWTLKDSLMEVFRGEPQHNFWTTAPIEPATSYQITVRNPEGDTTQAQTTTPASPPDVTPKGEIKLPCLSAEEANTFDVRVDGATELAALKVKYFQTLPYSEDLQFTFLFDSYDDAEKNADTIYTATINYREDLVTTNQTRDRQCLTDSAHVIAAAGGPDWPEWARYHDATISDLARPDSFSNVTGGHGMFSGVFTGRATVTVDDRNPD